MESCSIMKEKAFNNQSFKSRREYNKMKAWKNDYSFTLLLWTVWHLKSTVNNVKHMWGYCWVWKYFFQLRRPCRNWTKKQKVLYKLNHIRCCTHTALHVWWYSISAPVKLHFSWFNMSNTSLPIGRWAVTMATPESTLQNSSGQGIL